MASSTPPPSCNREMSPSTVSSITQEVPETNSRGMPATTNADPIVTLEEASVNMASPSPHVSSVLHSGGDNNKDTNDDDNNNNMSSHRKGRWTLDEKVLFLHGLKMYGKGRWKRISIFLPHRSLVQIKSHAQKVLKRQEYGENVFRRLDEHGYRLKSLVNAVFDEQGIRMCPAPPEPTTTKKRKARATTTAVKKQQQQQQQKPPYHPLFVHSFDPVRMPSSSSSMVASSANQSVPESMDGGLAQFHGSTAVAAAALCQLSCTEPSSPIATPVESIIDSLQVASSSSRQAFFPVDPDPAVFPRARNVVSP